ncbi:hypothetical protein [Shinella sp.]|uniref:hypothetical protein n=1 Tax=Shinella sp. TaxID=1870904 RepID=UPI003F72AA9B
MEELIKSLPPMALLGVGIAVGVGLLVRYLGLAQGQAVSPAATSSAAQVAAVIVDPSALNRLSDQVGKLVDAVTALVEVGEELTKTESHMAIELDRIREEMRIQREVSRRG